MRYIKYAVLAAIVILLVSFSIANRQIVTLQLVHGDLEGLVRFNYSITLPLFLVLLGGVAIGLFVGFILEWLREHRHRRDASVCRREARRLAREVARLKTEKHEGKDEVLAILEGAR
ncbi:MAG: LapA family protein [Rhodobacteraceae bacterium]|nr:LapA family protein [Paracoccaceae bacterium]